MTLLETDKGLHFCATVPRTRAFADLVQRLNLGLLDSRGVCARIGFPAALLAQRPDELTLEDDCQIASLALLERKRGHMAGSWWRALKR